MKRAPVLVLLLSALLGTACQHAARSGPVDVSIGEQTDALFASLVVLQRDLHKHPELAGAEARTQDVVARHLRQLGLEVQTGQYGRSVIATLRGAYPGRTIAWRAELDALPSDFPDDVPHRSQTPGVQHGCGHDVHIAIALGIASVLAARRADLHGTIVFVFQPEEETFRGARALVERSIWSALRVDEIYGLHVTALPVGQVFVRSDEMFAHQRRVQLQLRGTLDSASVVSLTRGLERALARMRRDATPWDLSKVNDPVWGLRSPNSAFADYRIVNGMWASRIEAGDQVLETDVYDTSRDSVARLVVDVERAIDAAGYAARRRDVRIVQANPTVQNDTALTRDAVRRLRRVAGDTAVHLMQGQVPFFNDDFAYFQQSTPGVYFFLGGSNASEGIVAMNHAPGFRVDDEAMRVGVRLFATLLLARR